MRGTRDLTSLIMGIFCSLSLALLSAWYAVDIIDHSMTGSISVNVISSYGTPVSGCHVSVDPIGNHKVPMDLMDYVSNGSPMIFERSFGTWKVNVGCGVEARYSQGITPCDLHKTVIIDSHKPHVKVYLQVE